MNQITAEEGSVGDAASTEAERLREGIRRHQLRQPEMAAPTEADYELWSLLDDDQGGFPLRLKRDPETGEVWAYNETDQAADLDLTLSGRRYRQTLPSRTWVQLHPLVAES